MVIICVSMPVGARTGAFAGMGSMGAARARRWMKERARREVNMVRRSIEQSVPFLFSRGV